MLIVNETINKQNIVTTLTDAGCSHAQWSLIVVTHSGHSQWSLCWKVKAVYISDNSDAVAVAACYDVDW